MTAIDVITAGFCQNRYCQSLIVNSNYQVRSWKFLTSEIETWPNFIFFISLAPNIEIFVDFLLKFVDFLLKNNVAEKTYRLYKEAFS